MDIGRVPRASGPAGGDLPAPEKGGGLVGLSVIAMAGGALTGLVATAFRILLEAAERLRGEFIAAAHERPLVGFLIVVALAAQAALVAAWLVRRFSPHAAGSGIPHVEAVIHGAVAPAPLLLVPVKFIGGLLAIGSGLMLGREGPSVQMGAGISHAVGKLFGRNEADGRVLLATGAGAGLATAFNAPVAGAVFVLEELVQQFEHRIAITALGAAGGAIAVSRLMISDQPDFSVAPLATPGLVSWPLFMLLGCIAGLFGVFYNRSILGTLALADAAKGVPVEVRAGLVGALLGAIAWFAPGLVGGGDNITQSILSGQVLLVSLPAAFVLRFAMGTVSYAAGTPGGLFAPLLVLGTQIGFVFGSACNMLLHLPVPPEAFAVAGMAAFFAAVVRAPLTGIVLVGEMTASPSMVVPGIFASFIAMIVATLLREQPIYDSLRDRTIRLDQRLRGTARPAG